MSASLACPVRTGCHSLTSVARAAAASRSEKASRGDALAMTACAVAAARAVESSRDDALFQDVWADVLAGPEGHSFNNVGLTDMIAVRTAFIDKFVREQYDAGTRQVVLLGAGLDARAYRMDLAEAHFFELDQQVLFDVKEPLLARAELQCARRVTMSFDLGNKNLDLVSALQKNGFVIMRPSCWVLEGLIMYMRPAEVEQLARQVSALSSVRSAFIHDAVSATAKKMGIEFCGAKFRSGNDDYAGLWKAAGFTQANVINWDAIFADRPAGNVAVDSIVADASPKRLRGQEAVVMVIGRKTPAGSRQQVSSRTRVTVAPRQREANANRFSALAGADRSDDESGEDACA